MINTSRWGPMFEQPGESKAGFVIGVEVQDEPSPIGKEPTPGSLERI